MEIESIIGKQVIDIEYDGDLLLIIYFHDGTKLKIESGSGYSHFGGHEAYLDIDYND